MTPHCLAFLDVFGNFPAISQASWWEDVGGRVMGLPLWSHTAENCSSFPGPRAACVTQGVPAPEMHAGRRLE